MHGVQSYHHACRLEVVAGVPSPSPTPSRHRRCARWKGYSDLQVGWGSEAAKLRVVVYSVKHAKLYTIWWHCMVCISCYASVQYYWQTSANLAISMEWPDSTNALSLSALKVLSMRLSLSLELATCTFSHNCTLPVYRLWNSRMITEKMNLRPGGTKSEVLWCS